MLLNGKIWNNSYIIPVTLSILEPSLRLNDQSIGLVSINGITCHHFTPVIATFPDTINRKDYI